MTTIRRPCWTETISTLARSGDPHAMPEYSGCVPLTKWLRPVDRRCSTILVVPRIARIEVCIADDDLREGDSAEFIMDMMQRGFAAAARRPRFRLCRNRPEPFYVRRPNAH